MTKRIIKIILILLAIFALLLGGIWLIGRRQATKNGKTPATFKQFLGLGGKTIPPPPDTGTTTSIFTDNSPQGSLEDLGTGNGDGFGNGNGITGTGDITDSSQFTGDGISLGDNGAIGAGNGFGVGGNITTTGNIGDSGTIGDTGNDSGNGSTNIGGTDGTNPGSGGSTNALASCSTADITIAFTPDEIAQLQKLQDRYNAIAGHLAGTDEIASEASLYDDYKLEEARIIEMQNFCQATAPLIANPIMQRRVPTPFWNNGVTTAVPFSTPVGTDPNPLINVILERILRINLW